MQYDAVANQTNARLGCVVGEPSARISHRFPLKWKVYISSRFVSLEMSWSHKPNQSFAVSEQGLGNPAEIQTRAVLLLCVSTRCLGATALAPAGNGTFGAAPVMSHRTGPMTCPIGLSSYISAGKTSTHHFLHLLILILLLLPFPSQRASRRGVRG